MARAIIVIVVEISLIFVSRLVISNSEWWAATLSSVATPSQMPSRPAPAMRFYGGPKVGWSDRSTSGPLVQDHRPLLRQHGSREHKLQAPRHVRVFDSSRRLCPWLPVFLHQELFLGAPRGRVEEEAENDSEELTIVRYEFVVASHGSARSPE